MQDLKSSMLVPTRTTHSKKHSGIPPPKRLSSTLPHSVCPHISQRVTVSTRESRYVPVGMGNPGPCEDICAIHNPLFSEMRGKVAKRSLDGITLLKRIRHREGKSRFSWLTDLGEKIEMTDQTRAFRHTNDCNRTLEPTTVSEQADSILFGAFRPKT